MSDLNVGYNVIDYENITVRSAVIEKSIDSGETTFYFEPHSERWYITREQASTLIRMLTDFIATQQAAPDGESGAE